MTTMKGKENDEVNQEESGINTVATVSLGTEAFPATDALIEQVGLSAQELQESDTAAKNGTNVAFIPKRQKRHIWFSEDQLEYLLNSFNKNSSPSMEDRKLIANQTKSDPDRVSRWFKNRRDREKRKTKSCSESTASDSQSENSLSAPIEHAERDKDSQGEENGEAMEVDEDQFEKDIDAEENVQSSVETNVAIISKSQKLHVWFSDEHLEILRNYFNVNPLPSKEDRESIAEKIKSDLDRVTQWFERKRYRENKKAKNSSTASGSLVKADNAAQQKKPKIGDFTSDELCILNAHYENEEYPDRSTREEIAEQLNCTYTKISNWFEKRRFKDRENEVMLPPRPINRKKRKIRDSELSTSSAPEEKKIKENGTCPENSFENLHSKIIFRMTKLLEQLDAKLLKRLDANSLEQHDAKLLEQQKEDHKKWSEVLEYAKTQTGSLELMKVVFEGLKGKKGDEFAGTVKDCEAFFKEGGYCCGKYFDCDPIQTCARCGEQFHSVCRDIGGRSNGGENQCPCRVRKTILFKYRSTDIPIDACAASLTKDVKEWVDTKRKFSIRVTTAEDMVADMGEELEAFFKKMKKNLPVQRIRNKMIFVFIDDEGDEILFFAMLASEYKDADLVTIRYLESVSFIDDRDLRTNMYNSIVLAYMGYTASIGYKKTHFWACPPDSEFSYLFRGRPAWQRVLTPEELIDWYVGLLKIGKERGVIAEYGRDYDGPVENKLFKQIEHMICDGGYWNQIIGKKLFIKTYNGSKPRQQQVLSDLRAEMKLDNKPIFYIELISRIMGAMEKSEVASLFSELTKTDKTWTDFLKENNLDFTYVETAKYATAFIIHTLIRELIATGQMADPRASSSLPGCSSDSSPSTSSSC